MTADEIPPDTDPVSRDSTAAPQPSAQIPVGHPTTPSDRFRRSLTSYRQFLENLREFFIRLTPLVEELDQAYKTQLMRDTTTLLEDVVARKRPDEIKDAKTVVKLLELSRGLEDPYPDVEIPESGPAFRTAVGRDFLHMFLKEMQRPPVRSQYETLATSVITNIVTLFETLLADLMGAYYQLYPGATSGEEKVISLDELRAHGTIESAIEAIVQKRISAFIAGGPTDWQRDLKSRLKIEVDQLIPEWPQCVEVIQRRHVIVHSNGTVDKDYLAKVDFDNVAYPEEKPELGTEAQSHAEYVSHALDLFEVAGVQLAHAFWRKLCKEDTDSLDRFAAYPSAFSIHGVSYDALTRRRWFVAQCITEFAQSDEAASDLDKLICRFNQLLAQKRLHGMDSVHDTLLSMDLSAAHPKFSLVRASLLEDADAFFRLLPSAGLELSDLRDWPILDEMRTDDRFVAEMARAFGEDDTQERPAAEESVIQMREVIDKKSELPDQGEAARTSEGMDNAGLLSLDR